MKKFFYLLLSMLMLSTFVWASKTANIKKTDKAPVIDGAIDDVWKAIVAESFDVEVSTGTGDASVTATWKAMWDQTNVYFLFEVKDDSVMNTGTSDGSIPWYLHDCIEVFTDMQNGISGAAVTNSNGEYQLRFIYGMDDEPIFENKTMTDQKNVSVKTKDGYVIEVSFPWAYLIAGTDVAIKEGLTFGIDMKVCDMDEANPTNNWWPAHFEYAWVSTKDKKPSNFGEATLTSGTNVTTNAINNELRVYPNPAKDVVQLKVPSALYTNLEVIDLSGKVVLKQSLSGNNGINNVNIKNFSSGIYILSVSGNNQVLRSKLIVK